MLDSQHNEDSQMSGPGSSNPPSPHPQADPASSEAEGSAANAVGPPLPGSSSERGLAAWALVIAASLLLCGALLWWVRAGAPAEQAQAGPPEAPSAGAAEPVATAALDPVAEGRLLFEGFACASCHEAQGAGTGIDVPPSLRFEGSRAQQAWIEQFLLSPSSIRFASDGVRPGLQMPNFGLAPAQASALAAYLGAQRDTALVPEGDPVADDAVAAANDDVNDTATDNATDDATADDAAADPDPEEGRRLFVEYQCMGCHQLEGQGAEIGPHLDGVALRLRPAYMRALLADPNKVIPGTPMKNMEFWEEELNAVVAYLKTLRTPRAEDPSRDAPATSGGCCPPPSQVR